MDKKFRVSLGEIFRAFNIDGFTSSNKRDVLCEQSSCDPSILWYAHKYLSLSVIEDKIVIMERCIS
jgi:hypothetical protein